VGTATLPAGDGLRARLVVPRVIDVAAAAGAAAQHPSISSSPVRPDYQWEQLTTDRNLKVGSKMWHHTRSPTRVLVGDGQRILKRFSLPLRLVRYSKHAHQHLVLRLSVM
jgi:hypothetical protein